MFHDTRNRKTYQSVQFGLLARRTILAYFDCFRVGNRQKFKFCAKYTSQTLEITPTMTFARKTFDCFDTFLNNDVSPKFAKIGNFTKFWKKLLCQELPAKPDKNGVEWEWNGRHFLRMTSEDSFIPQLIKSHACDCSCSLHTSVSLFAFGKSEFKCYPKIWKIRLS